MDPAKAFYWMVPQIPFWSYIENLWVFEIFDWKKGGDYIRPRYRSHVHHDLEMLQNKIRQNEGRIAVIWRIFEGLWNLQNK